MCRLPLEGHSQEHVRRLGLVAVLGQPDRLSPEERLTRIRSFLIVAIVITGAVLAAAAGRRLGRRRGVRVVGVGVELRARLRAMPRTQVVGATPPAAPRGPVTPPPTRA